MLLITALKMIDFNLIEYSVLYKLHHQDLEDYQLFLKELSIKLVSFLLMVLTMDNTMDYPY